MQSTPGPTTRILIFALSFLAVWTTWAIYLSLHPLPPQAWPIRLSVRLILFIIPTLLYIRFALHHQPYRYLRLTVHLPAGALYGAIAGLLPLSSLIWRSLHAHALPALPHSPDLWLNTILAAPLAEEILFRGLLFRELSRISGPILGAIYSSLLFAALHFPFWYFSGAKSGLDLAASLTQIFAVGLLCCALVYKSRTLVAPIVFHFLNNLASNCTI